MRKMHSFEFSKEGLEEAINFKEEYRLVKYAPLVIGIAAVAFVVYTTPGASVAGMGTVEEVAKQAFRLKMGGI